MKRVCAMLLCLLLLLSMLAGCRASNVESSGTTAPAETTGEPTLSVEEIPPEEVEATVPKEGLTGPEGESELVIGNTGRIRVDYAGNISSVRYITSVEQLPEYEALQGYDAAYFRDKALILVLETVTSGTVQVDIRGITLEGENAMVQLSHEAQGDVSTAVMTTWLIWAEVDAGLDYTWTVSNPAVESQAERS